MSRSQQLTVDQALSRAKKAAKQGNIAAALQLYSAVLQQQPGHPVAKKALRKLEKMLPPSPSPDEIKALNHLYHSGQIELAEQSCNSLLQTYPQSLNVINVLGAALQVQGKSQEAVEVFERAIELNPGFAEAYSNRGNALKELGQLENAVASYDTAIQLKIDFADAYFNRGNALKDLGRTGQAIDDYEETIRLRPGFAAAHRNLGALKTYTADDSQIAVMEDLYDGLAANDSNRIELCFALAKAHDDLGDYDKSFKYLEEGNRLRKKELNYDIDVDRKEFGEIKEIFAAGIPTGELAPKDMAPFRPIFIVGMMRSGTSVAEQILASHSEVYGAGELEVMNQLVSPNLAAGVDVSAHEIEAIRTAYLEGLAALQVSEQIITDKMPLNFRWLGFILAAFPDAKIIHVNRDPIATCWSNYKHFFPTTGNGYAYDFTDLANFYGLYVDWMSFWRERIPDSIYELGYEALTENQEEETRKLLSFCDLEWEHQCLDFHRTKRAVRTTSAVQVRKKMYTGSSEAWRKYADHLQPLLDGLKYQ